MNDLERILAEGPTYLRGLKEEDRNLLVDLLKKSSIEGKPIAVSLLEQNQIGLALVGMQAKYETLTDQVESRFDKMRAHVLADMFAVATTRLTNNQIDIQLAEYAEAHTAYGTLEQQLQDLKSVVRFLDSFRSYIEKTRGHVVVQLSVNERRTDD
jgi:hypothetical protein